MQYDWLKWLKMYLPGFHVHQAFQNGPLFLVLPVNPQKKSIHYLLDAHKFNKTQEENEFSGQ